MNAVECLKAQAMLACSQNRKTKRTDRRLAGKYSALKRIVDRQILEPLFGCGRQLRVWLAFARRLMQAICRIAKQAELSLKLPA